MLASDGTVWTWGSNSEGQLGNGPFTSPPGPNQVYGLGDVEAIAAGFAHTLALKRDGTVWAWGKNREGQLGDGTTVNRATPVQVWGLTDVAAVAAGNSHGLALKRDGTVWAWGSNGSGELGDDTTISRAVPAAVHSLSGVIAIAAGQAHSLAVRGDGTVWAWGNNWYGQLGIGVVGPDSSASKPVQIAGLGAVIAIAAGYQHSMALKVDGTVSVWGNDGAFAILGPTPVDVAGLSNVQAIAAGCGTSLAVKDDGTVWEWGYDILFRPTYATAIRTTPTKVMELTDAQKVALPAGGNHGLALMRDGTALEWGGFQNIQLGQPSMAHPVPSRITGLSAVAAISRGLALKNDGTLWAWDAPFLTGWLDRSAPFEVSGLNGIVAIASGTTGYDLALKNDGTVWNVFGRSIAYSVPNLSGVVAVAAGESHALAVKADGTVWDWSGVNSTPVQVDGLNDVTAVSAAFEEWWGFEADEIRARNLALKRDGTVWRWDGAWAKTSPPAQVNELSSITAIAGGEISLALKGDGTVWQWDATDDQAVPTQVSGLAAVKAIAIGGAQAAFMTMEAHALALKEDGTIWAWGPNERGQLGDGTTADRSSPVQVAGLSDIIAIAAAGFSSVAAGRDGTAWAWGAAGNQFESTPSPPIRVPPLGSPDLAVTLSHSEDFRVGEVGLYKVSIVNLGRMATAGPVILTDTLPPGLTFVSATGEGWVCAEAGRIVTCTNPGSFGGGDSTVVSIAVGVQPQAYPGVTNLATISNESDLSAWNNAIGDPTVVLLAR